MVHISVKADPELHRLLAAIAERENISLGEVLVRLAAKHVERPDLAVVPRKKQGRRPSVPVAAAN